MITNTIRHSVVAISLVSQSTKIKFPTKVSSCLRLSALAIVGYHNAYKINTYTYTALTYNRQID